MLRRIKSQSSTRANPTHRAHAKGKSNGARRTNPASGMSLREALASRSNGVARRTNPASGMSLREALASRRNPLIDRAEVRTSVTDLQTKHREAKKAYEQDPTALNRRILERRERALKDFQAELTSTSAALGGKKDTIRKWPIETNQQTGQSPFHNIQAASR